MFSTKENVVGIHLIVKLLLLLFFLSFFPYLPSSFVVLWVYNVFRTTENYYYLSLGFFFLIGIYDSEQVCWYSQIWIACVVWLRKHKNDPWLVVNWNVKDIVNSLFCSLQQQIRLVMTKVYINTSYIYIV